jgi:saccharopine dehydrogenase-like NADP-dependent oxidoreductase
MKKILLIGGYGKVGTEAAGLLSSLPDIQLSIGGRNIEKAKALASKLNADAVYVDTDNILSIEEVVRDTDIVINCFIDIDKVNTDVAKTAIKFGKIYIDPAGAPNEHLYAIIALHHEAVAGNALLVTGLGVNPGIIGILLQNNASRFDEVTESEVFFTLGSDFEDISVLSLRGVGKMTSVAPKMIVNGSFVKPLKASKKQFIESPFNKQIFFGASAFTPDIEKIPELTKIKQVSIWSGVERFLQSMVFIMGIKLGYTKSDKKAEKFLTFLKYLGRNKKYSPELNLTILTKGITAGKPYLRSSSFSCTEVKATAISPVVFCKQLIENGYSQKGAFYPVQIINTDDFIKKLADSDIGFKDETIEIK